MHGSKEQAVAKVLGNQTEAKGQDEQKRTEVANRIQGIYNNTKQKVEASLNQLDSQVNTQFDQGAAAAKSLFENYVDQRMKRYKDERYSGPIGWGRWVKDKFRGMPSEVNVFYQEGKQQYLGSMDKTIDQIANLVATQLNAAKAEIAKGKQEIQKYVAGLEPSLRQVGQEAAQNIQGKFNELEQSVDNKQDDLIDSLALKYNDNIKALDARIDEMKAENQGLVEKAKKLIVDTIQTINELKNMLMGVLQRAGGVIGKIIQDPIGFLGHLIAGLKQGFLNFKDNISQHLKKGFMGFLTGAMASTGIQMPKSFDMKGIFGLVTQVLGMTYEGIRPKAVKRMGEKNVNALESNFEMFVILKNEGTGGLWKFIQGQIGDLKSMVIDTLQSFIIEKVIISGITWILSLLNPASAFVRACKAIIDIIMFFIERASQIVELINAIIEAVTAIASGAIGGAAKAIENALSKSLPVVISFMASLLGIGGISDKVQEVIKRVRQPIEKAIDWVIEQAVKFAKKIGGKLGFGKGKGKNKKDRTKNPEDSAEDKNKSKEANKDEKTKNNKTENERSYEDKKKGLENAEKKMQVIISKSKTTKEVERHFPAVKKEFGLKKLEWDKLATPSAAIIMEVNPKAIISLSGSPLVLNVLNEGDTSHSNKFKQEVTFETHKIDGHLVGKKMEAKKLGPNHPQGSPPLGGALSGLMKELETDPKLKNENKYIKGHLLNDNLGGPGSAQNLYPITADANSKHERNVERLVKDWVNNKGYWVYYKVEVANEKIDLAKGMINADFVCEAAPLDVDGKKSFDGAFNTTIRSEVGAKNGSTQNEIKREEFSDKKPENDPTFDSSKVEISSGKKRKYEEIEDV